MANLKKKYNSVQTSPGTLPRVPLHCVVIHRSLSVFIFSQKERICYSITSHDALLLQTSE